MRLYDSLSRKQVSLVPLRPQGLGLYVCGLTPYGPSHLGHARTFAVFDTLVRYLRWRNLKVRYVRNITDLDDRIIETAQARGISGAALVEEQVARMHAEFDALGMLRPDEEPRATRHIPAMLEMIQALLDKGKAYATASGDLFCRVRECPGYGCLSGRRLEDLQAGVRKEVDASKEHPEDFALWKSADEAARATGLVWDSPWGQGRPGWHIECSAMALELLGEDFDLHGGGLDLKFPHHENEIAQAEGAGRSFARRWMHAAPLRLRGEKMSKSLGNVSTVADALDEQPPQVVRLALLSTHYRTALECDESSFSQAGKALRKLWAPLSGDASRACPRLAGVGTGSAGLEGRLQDAFIAAMEDDLDIPAALAAMHKRASSLPATRSSVEVWGQMLEVLGIHPDSGAAPGRAESLAPGEAEAMVRRRLEHKAAREWDAADALRERLEEAGLELRDEASGTSWRRPGQGWQQVPD